MTTATVYIIAVWNTEMKIYWFKCAHSNSKKSYNRHLKHLYIYLIWILIFVLIILQQSGWKAGLVLRALLASLPNQFCCPALVWKEQTVTVYGIISQIPGASHTCYMLLESVKSMLSTASSYLLIFKFLVHEVQLSFHCNLHCASACHGPWSSRFQTVWSCIEWKLKGKYFRCTKVARWLCHFYL